GEDTEESPLAALLPGTAMTSESAEAAATASSASVAAAAGAAGPAATAPASGTDVKRVDRNLDRLLPEFRHRLDRVVARMESEFGHEVTVVEAHRSQERQNYLYQRGRSLPGQVVTWTRNSNHTAGRAVDVMIDGTYDNA